MKPTESNPEMKGASGASPHQKRGLLIDELCHRALGVHPQQLNSQTTMKTREKRRRSALEE
jgi:hypothetical protein